MAVEADVKVYEGSVLPEVVVQFTDGSGVPVAFEASDSAHFYMRSSDLTVEAMEIDGLEMEISDEDRLRGIVRYFWSAGDTDTPGRYFAVAEATLDGRLWREPRDGYLTVEVIPMLKAIMHE